MKASEIMTRDVLTVRADMPLADALTLMASSRVSGLPVVDAENQLVGILTQGDLLHRSEMGTGAMRRSKLLDFLLGPGRAAQDYVATNSRRVEDLMTRDVVCVNEDADL